MELHMVVFHRNTKLKFIIVDSLGPLVFLVANISGGAETAEDIFTNFSVRRNNSNIFYIV